jgi:hypothetical protein
MNRLSENVIAKLNAAVMDVLADAAVRQRLADLGFEISRREMQTGSARRLSESRDREVVANH